MYTRYKFSSNFYVTICVVAPLARDVCRQMYMGVTSFKLFPAIQFFARLLSDLFHNTSNLSRINYDELSCANVLFSFGEIIEHE